MLSIMDEGGLVRYPGHSAAVTALAFHGPSESLASGDVERGLCLWSRQSLVWKHSLRGGQVWTKSRNALRMRSLAFSASGDTLFVAGNERLESLSTADGSYGWCFEAPRTWGFLASLPLTVAVSSSGAVAATFDNGTMGLWSESGKRLAWFRGAEVPDRLGFIAGGSLLAGMSPFRLSLFDVEAARRVSYFESRTRFIAFAVHPDEACVACRSLENVFLFDPRTGASLGGFPAGYGLPLMSFRPHERSLAVSNIGRIEVRDYSGHVQKSFSLQGRRCTALCWSTEGNQLAVGCSDGDLMTIPVS